MATGLHPTALAQACCTPAAEDVVDASEIRVAPLPIDALILYLKSNPPAGAQIESTSVATSGVQSLSELTPYAPGLGFAQISFELLPLSAASTILRIDGEAIWLHERTAGEDVSAVEKVVKIFRSAVLPSSPAQPTSLTLTTPSSVANFADVFNALPTDAAATSSCPVGGFVYEVEFANSINAAPTFIASEQSCDVWRVTVAGQAGTALQGAGNLDATLSNLFPLPIDQR